MLFRKHMLALLTMVSLAAIAPSVHAQFLTHKAGTQISKEQMDALEVGKTTKQQVLEAFGAPNRREQLGDVQVWYYDFTKIATFGKNVSESTVLEFDKAGVLVSKAKSGGAGGAGKTGNPLLDAAQGK